MYDVYQAGLPTGLTLSVQFLAAGVNAGSPVALTEAPAGSGAYGNASSLSLSSGTYAWYIKDGSGNQYATNDLPFVWTGSEQVYPAVQRNVIAE